MALPVSADEGMWPLHQVPLAQGDPLCGQVGLRLLLSLGAGRRRSDERDRGQQRGGCPDGVLDLHGRLPSGPVPRRMFGATLFLPAR